VQIICTFNSTVNMIDQALMRKGRLIAKYEFGKLNKSKSEKLSKHLGFKTSIIQAMTIAEIANQDDKDYDMKRIEVVGFRRQEEMMN
jgi:ATP-dependent 26S proteasome regulatory subunit